MLNPNSIIVDEDFLTWALGLQPRDSPGGPTRVAVNAPLTGYIIFKLMAGLLERAKRMTASALFACCRLRQYWIPGRPRFLPAMLFAMRNQAGCGLQVHQVSTCDKSGVMQRTTRILGAWLSNCD